MDDWPDHDYDFTKPPFSDRYGNAVPIAIALLFLVAVVLGLCALAAMIL